MERLTAWSDYGAYFPKCYEEPCDGNGTENDCDNCDFMAEVCWKLAQYEDIGTLEEVRDAVERQRAKKPKTKILCGDIEWWCPNCGENHTVLDSKKGFDFCHHCGQKLDWGEEDEQ